MSEPADVLTPTVQLSRCESYSAQSFACHGQRPYPQNRSAQVKTLVAAGSLHLELPRFDHRRRNLPYTVLYTLSMQARQPAIDVDILTSASAALISSVWHSHWGSATICPT